MQDYLENQLPALQASSLEGLVSSWWRSRLQVDSLPMWENTEPLQRCCINHLLADWPRPTAGTAGKKDTEKERKVTSPPPHCSSAGHDWAFVAAALGRLIRSVVVALSTTPRTLQEAAHNALPEPEFIKLPTDTVLQEDHSNKFTPPPQHE